MGKTTPEGAMRSFGFGDLDGGIAHSPDSPIRL